MITSVGVGLPEVAMWTPLRQEGLTDRGKLLFFFYAAWHAGTIVTDRITDTIVFLLVKEHGAPFGYSFQFRGFPRSPRLHEDLYLLREVGEVVCSYSQLNITRLGSEWVKAKLQKHPDLAFDMELMTEYLRSYRIWDRKQYFDAVYSSLAVRGKGVGCG